MEPNEMQIIMERPEWVICVKPAGMESEKEAPEHLKGLCGGSFFPVHRLDRQVAGLMVFARSRDAAAKLSRLISEGRMEKEYVALCHGTLPPDGRLEDLLWKDSAKNRVYVVRRLRAGVRKASLTFRLLCRPGPDASLIRIRLETGRSHQIRVQFASRGCPLWGDHQYGARDPEKMPLLFSCLLSFPWEGETIRMEVLPRWAASAARGG